jgi:drug/metabolite transporter (DMT)-like permease
MPPQPAPRTDDLPAQRRSPIDSAFLLLAFASLCWSGNHIVGRAIAGHVPPVAVSVARWLLPMLVIVLIAREHLARDWPAIRSGWRIMLFFGLAGGTVFGMLQYLALNYTTALNVSVLNSLGPVFIVAAGALVYRDRLTWMQGFGIAVSLLGVLVIVTRADLAALLGLSFNLGDLLIVLNQAIWAFYSIFLRKKPDIHWLSFMFVLAVISTVTTIPLAVIEHLGGARLHADWITAGAIVFVGIFPSLLAFASWNRGVALIGTNRAGPFLHLIPLYSVLLATFLLGEHLMAFHALGFALIVAGVWLAARRRDAPAAP